MLNFSRDIMKKAVILIVLLLPIFVYSQTSTFFNSGVSGFDLSAGYVTNNDVSGIQGLVGFTLKSRVNFSIGIARLKSFIDNINEEIYTTAIAPGVSINIFKQNNKIPISWNVSGRFEYDNYEAEFLDEAGWESTTTGIILSTYIYRTITLRNRICFIPKIGFGFSKAETVIKDSYNNEDSETDEFFNFGFGFGIGFPIGTRQYFYLDPMISVTEQNTTIGIGIGFTIPTSRSQNDHRKIINDKRLNDIEYLLGRKKSYYLDIENIRSKYILVIKSTTTPMLIGDSFNLIRQKNSKNIDNYEIIGTAKVVKIDKNNVVLEFKASDTSTKIRLSDKIEFIK